jgi:hypothetical protein
VPSWKTGKAGIGCAFLTPRGTGFAGIARNIRTDWTCTSISLKNLAISTVGVSYALGGFQMIAIDAGEAVILGSA